jgi:hypothetical protein
MPLYILIKYFEFLSEEYINFTIPLDSKYYHVYPDRTEESYG